MFTDKELAYLREHRIGRLATVDASGQPHVVPTGFSVDAEHGAIEIGAHDLPDRRQERRYRRNIAANPNAAFVVDDLASTGPWTPWGRGPRPRGAATQGRRAARARLRPDLDQAHPNLDLLMGHRHRLARTTPKSQGRLKTSHMGDVSAARAASDCWPCR
jgi:PPOX class F420-dependent enzyme/OxyR family protein